MEAGDPKISTKRRTSILEILVGSTFIASLILLYVIALSEPFTMFRHHIVSYPTAYSEASPDSVAGVKTITSPNGVKLRYKEPGKEGICETTPGVNSYSGYIDLAEDLHTFFWFFEARKNADTAPITLWRKYPVTWPASTNTTKLTTPSSQWRPWCGFFGRNVSGYETIVHHQ